MAILSLDLFCFDSCVFVVQCTVIPCVFIDQAGMDYGIIFSLGSGLDFESSLGQSF